MERRKEEYPAGQSSNQAAYPSAPYFESFLQGISVSTSATDSPSTDAGYQSWTAAFGDAYPGYSDWSVYSRNSALFSNNAPILGTGLNLSLDDSLSATPNVPTYEDYYSSIGQPDIVSEPNPETCTLGAFGGFGGLGIHDFSSSSGQEFCTDAASHLHSYPSRTYDPFGTGPVFPAESEENDTDNNSPASARSSSPVSSKPTYSDVAKNRPKISTTPTNTITSKVRETKPPVAEFPSPPTYLKVPYKKTKSSRVHLKTKNSADPSPVVKPDSKYGLDYFEDPSKVLKERTKRQHSHSGSDSMPPSRKGSTSSLGSASSGLDDVSFRGSFTDLKSPPGEEQKTSKASEADASVLLETNESQSFSTNAGHRKDTETKKKDRKYSAKTGSRDKVFFDPKLIFQPRADAKSRRVTETIPNNQQSDKPAAEMLNNGKPKSNLYNSNFDKSSSTHYINNDLGQGKKQTNMDTQRSSQDRSKTSNVENSSTRRRGDSSQSRKPDLKPSTVPTRKTKKCKDEPNPIGEYLNRACKWVSWALKEFFHVLQNVGLLALKCTVLLCLLLGQYMLDFALGAWNCIRTRLPGFHKQSNDWSNSSSQNRLKSQGLDENITLPTTGEEAMKRLLACKGKDPFSILGVRTDASDEQIKRYYRKQAVLVHPDKNQQPGAEEAFKILGHAFELVGEPEKRKKYREARETEAAMQEFADLLTKLHDKMQEAANTMRCDNCGGKHTRIATDRPFYSARYCDRCSTRHAAKEGDVWAESSVLGFLWHYYACMEGKVYDITEWASCQNTHFKHIQANAHQVIYRIATNATRRTNPQRTNEADLEDFFNQLFQNRRGEGEQAESYGYAGAGTQQNPPPTATSWSQAGRQQKKRKKKRH